MDYNSLIHSLPNKWCKTENEQNVKKEYVDTYLVVDGRHKNLNNICFKDMYRLFIKNISETPRAEIKWKKYLNMEENIWQDVYLTQCAEKLKYRVSSIKYYIIFILVIMCCQFGIKITSLCAIPVMII